MCVVLCVVLIIELLPTQYDSSYCPEVLVQWMLLVHDGPRDYSLPHCERFLATVLSPHRASRTFPRDCSVPRCALRECSLANISPQTFSREGCHSSSVALREWYHIVKFSSALLVRMRTWDLVARVVLSVKSGNCRVMTNREKKQEINVIVSDDRLERAITNPE